MKKVFVDGDGVLIDFVPTVCRVLSIKNDFKAGAWDMIPEACRKANITAKQFWEDVMTEEVWENMPWTKYGKDIVKMLYEAVGPQNVCMLTSPANPQAAAGRLAWIQREMPELYKLGNYDLRRNKGFIASEDIVLIDDGEHNITAYHLAGGPTILYPTPWNSRHTEAHLAMCHLRSEFLSWMDSK